MTDVREWVKKHALVAGFVAVLVPVIVLLVLQLRLVARLEEASAMARQAAVGNYLDAVVSEVTRYYRGLGERALTLPPTLFTEGRFEKAAMLWKKKPVEGARRYFLVDYTRDPFGNLWLLDPERGAFVRAAASDEALALILAVAPWQLVSVRGMPVTAAEVAADDRDAEHRILLYPVTDENSAVVGIAGLILDDAYFLDDLLPAIAARVGPGFFPEAERDELYVCVENDAGELVAGRPGIAHATTRRLAAPFSDWSLGVDLGSDTLAGWAKASVTTNITLAAIVAALLLGGALLALRTADRAYKLSEMKSEFVSNVSHELRTPLASIRVFAELLRSGRVQSPEKVMEYGEHIDVESQRLSRLIANILDFSRIESGRKTYQFIRSDVLLVAEATVQLFAAHRRNDGFRITLERPNAALPEVEMDPDAVGQAVYNLLDNAVKYSGASTAVEVAVRPERGGVAVAVTDHGIGIPKHEQKRIFERFHRVSTGLVHDVKGSGLGLSIVYHIATAHRGEVRVDSEPDRGSTFTLWLPAAA